MYQHAYYALWLCGAGCRLSMAKVTNYLFGGVAAHQGIYSGFPWWRRPSRWGDRLLLLVKDDAGGVLRRFPRVIMHEDFGRAENDLTPSVSVFVIGTFYVRLSGWLARC